MAKFRRRQKLPKRALQLRLVFTFVGLAALAMLLQALLFMALLSELAVVLPNDGSLVLERTNRLTFTVFGASALGFLPIIFAVGVLSTFRIAGPIRRFELFLEAMTRGEKPEDVRLRDHDQLEDFCDLLNRATRPLRAPETPAATGDTAELPAGTAEPAAPLPGEVLPSESRATTP